MRIRSVKELIREIEHCKEVIDSQSYDVDTFVHFEERLNKAQQELEEITDLHFRRHKDSK